MDAQDHPTEPHLSYEELLETIICDGIAEVTEAYPKEEDKPKREGAIAGFEACRGKVPAELVNLYLDANGKHHEAFRRSVYAAGDPIDLRAQFTHVQYYRLQIEWVCNVLSVAVGVSLLNHLPTARGAQCYARILAKKMGIIQP